MFGRRISVWCMCCWIIFQQLRYPSYSTHDRCDIDMAHEKFECPGLSLSQILMIVETWCVRKILTRVCFGRRFNLHCMCGWIFLEWLRYLGYSSGADDIQAEIGLEMSPLSLSIVGVIRGCLAGASACGVCVAGSYSNSSGIHHIAHMIGATTRWPIKKR